MQTYLKIKTPDNFPGSLPLEESINKRNGAEVEKGNMSVFHAYPSCIKAHSMKKFLALRKRSQVRHHLAESKPVCRRDPGIGPLDPCGKLSTLRALPDSTRPAPLMPAFTEHLSYKI